MLLHSYNDESVSIHPEFKDWNKVVEFLHISVKALGRGTVYAYPTPSNSSGSPPWISTRAADLLCLGAANSWHILNGSVKNAVDKFGDEILGPKAGIVLARMEDEHFNVQQYLGASISELTQMAHNKLFHRNRREFIIGLVESRGVLCWSGRGVAQLVGCWLRDLCLHISPHRLISRHRHCDLVE